MNAQYHASLQRPLLVYSTIFINVLYAITACFLLITAKATLADAAILIGAQVGVNGGAVWQYVRGRTQEKINNAATAGHEPFEPEQIDLPANFMTVSDQAPQPQPTRPYDADGERTA